MRIIKLEYNENSKTILIKAAVDKTKYGDKPCEGQYTITIEPDYEAPEVELSKANLYNYFFSYILGYLITHWGN